MYCNIVFYDFVGEGDDDQSHNMKQVKKKPISSWSDCFENVLHDPEGLDCFTVSKILLFIFED